VPRRHALAALRVRRHVFRFLRQHRELVTVAVLLVVPAVVYVSHANEPYVPGPVRSAVVWVTGPVESLLTWSAEAAQDGFYGYADLRKTREENLALRAAVLRERERSMRLDEVAAENLRLRRLAGFREGTTELRLTAASVVAFGPDPKFRSVRIDRGFVDGMRTGMAVLTPEGVVGRLAVVHERYSDLQLVTDPQSAVAVQSQRSRARATARGTSQGGRLRLDYVVRSEDLEDGDVLVTAASGGLFPKGLRVGRASRVAASDSGLFRTADLVPFVDFDALEEVLVVVDNGPTAALSEPAPALAPTAFPAPPSGAPASAAERVQ